MRLQRKVVDDVLGGDAAWKDADSTSGVYSSLFLDIGVSCASQSAASLTEVPALAFDLT